MSEFLLLAGIIALVLINVPIAVALGIAAVIAIATSHGAASLPNVAIDMYQGATNFPLIAIPLFILAGAIMNTSGISQRLIDFCNAAIGSMRGGLAQVNVVTSMFFAEISGSAVADVAATGPILIPAMKKLGYSGPFTAAVTSSTASCRGSSPASRCARSATGTPCARTIRRAIHFSFRTSGARSRKPTGR